MKKPPPWIVHHGDCLDVMRGMPDASVDAVVTDPPWMDYETGSYDASAWHKPIEVVDPSSYCAEFFRIAKDGTAHMLWVRWDCFHSHAEAMREAGFTVKNCIVWAKPNHTMGDLDGNVGNKHEMAVFAVKGAWTRHGSRDVNLWDSGHLFSRAHRDHPTQKPVDLMRRSVALVAKKGGTVLDPFLGSGTTGVAALEEGCRFVGIEREAEYVAIARARIEAAARAPMLDFGSVTQE